MLGNILGAAVGGMFANKAAKDQRRAMQEANQMRMMPYTDMQPYLLDFYSGGTDALQSALDAGYYGGPTRAGMDATTTEGLNAASGFGRTGIADATGFMNAGRGFAQNTADLYNRASQDMLGNATQYAANNVEPLLTSAMRDSRRQLEEQALPGVAMQASRSGNANSSRAGVREAILERGYADRETDMRSDLMDRLTNRSLQSQQNTLNNMTAANQNLGNLYNTGMTLGGQGAAALTGVGGAFQADAQAGMDDARQRFEGQRDFPMQLYGMYGQNILGRNPGGAAFGQINNNLADPNVAALGGAKAGAGMFGNIFSGLGGGGQSTGYFGGPFNMFQQRAAVAPSIASAGYY